MVTDSLLLFKVQDQIDAVDWCELASAENSVALSREPVVALEQP
jgi:hypothetical protein